MSTEDNDEPLDIEGVFTPVYYAKTRKPSWVVDGVLPPGLVFLGGPPKIVYKSTITAALAAEVAGYNQSVLLPEWKVRREGVVMMFPYEDEAGEIRHILEKGFGLELVNDDSILICDEPDTWRLDDEDAISKMLEWLKAKRPRLVVLDPLANFHSLEEKDAGGMIRILSPLRRWAKENDATFLIVHHTKKVDDERAYRASDLRGTSALFGICDGIMMATPTKNPLQVEIEATYKKHPGWTKTVDIAAWEKQGSQGAEALKATDKIVLRTIENGARTIEDVSRDAAINVGHVTKRVEFLKAQGYITKAGRKLTRTSKKVTT